MTTTLKKCHHFLIVEDEGDLCLLLEILLDTKGIELSQARTIADAHVLLKERRPDVILLDNRLPDGFGVDIIGELKSEHPAVRIIMMSGFDVDLQNLAVKGGADIFLSKPFTEKQLHQSINSVLK
jgi:DNA-binding response OmpR family regulator